MLPRTIDTDGFWQGYVGATGLPDNDYVVVALRRALDPAHADSSAALVLSGRKTATASLLRDYGDGEPLPAVGDHVVLTDGHLVPRCIWRTTEIAIKPMSAADGAFARDDGEDDLSLDMWHRRYREYFQHQARTEHFILGSDEMLVFERFELVWPRP